MPLNEEKISIGVVERETGLSKDLLRTWERRYGFPTPTRTEHDEREYSRADLERLKTIKRLLDNGMRPRKVVPLSADELELVANSLTTKQPDGESKIIAHAINLLKENDLDAFSAFLTNVLITNGLQRFVYDVAAPMNLAIGEAWFRGEVNVFHEHCYAAEMEALLCRTLSFLPQEKKTPRMLLTTVSGEQHYLGLMMARIIMMLDHADTVFLGPQLPNSEILAAADHFSPDIVALSFSSHFPLKRAQQALQSLQTKLPATVITIWAGGGQVHELAPLCPAIHFFSSLDEIHPALAQWRATHQS
jgi:DNA-binding transcriptional MerR regulator